MGHTSSNCLSCSRIAVSSSPGNQGIPGLSCLALRPPPSLSSLARYSCLSWNIALRHSLSNCRCHYGFDVQDGLNAAKLYQPKSKYKVRLECSERSVLPIEPKPFREPSTQQIRTPSSASSSRSCQAALPGTAR